MRIDTWSAARRRDAPRPARCAPPPRQHTCAPALRRDLRHRRATAAARPPPRPPRAPDQLGDLARGPRRPVAGSPSRGAGHRRHRRREHARRGRSGRRPTRTDADVDAEAHTRRLGAGVRHQPAELARRATRPAASASPTLDASVPPPWAMSSLPPPPPPSAVRRDPHQRRRPGCRARARRLVGRHDDDRTALGRAGDRDDARGARRRAGCAGRAPWCARRRRRASPAS